VAQFFSDSQCIYTYIWRRQNCSPPRPHATPLGDGDPWPGDPMLSMVRTTNMLLGYVICCLLIIRRKTAANAELYLCARCGDCGCTSVRSRFARTSRGPAEKKQSPL